MQIQQLYVEHFFGLSFLKQIIHLFSKRNHFLFELFVNLYIIQKTPSGISSLWGKLFIIAFVEYIAKTIQELIINFWKSFNLNLITVEYIFININYRRRRRKRNDLNSNWRKCNLWIIATDFRNSIEIGLSLDETTNFLRWLGNWNNESSIHPEKPNYCSKYMNQHKIWENLYLLNWNMSNCDKIYWLWCPWSCTKTTKQYAMNK
jgi:hypothetical protein